MTSSPHWDLDPQLARDTAAVGDLPLSRVLVSRDASYPWLILVPRRPGAVELIDLTDADQAQVMREIAQVGRVLKAVTRLRQAQHCGDRQRGGAIAYPCCCEAPR